MVALFVGGQKVAWSEAERLFGEPSTLECRVELRNAAGRVVARFIAEPTTTDDYPDSVKAITPEEIARRQAEPAFTIDEVRKRLGWA